jgi:hypothetical protein
LIRVTRTGYDRSMSISPVYGASSGMSVVPSALSVVPSALSVVPSGQSDSSLQELVERQRGDISLYKNVAIGSVIVAGAAVAYTVFQQYMQRQRVTLARAEGATLGYTPPVRGRGPVPRYPEPGYGPQGYPPSYY